MAPTPQMDAVPVCFATTMADANSIELRGVRARPPARSASSSAADAVARISETIHSSPRGLMLRADADEDVLITRGNAWFTAKGVAVD